MVQLVSFLKNQYLKIAVFIVFTCMFFVTDYNLLQNPAAAAIPDTDREQFISGWPSGYGVKETIAFLKEKSQNQKIYVATQGTFGLMPYALEMYFTADPNVKISGFWPVPDMPPKPLVEASKTMPTYVVFYQPCPACEGIGLAPKGWKVTKELQVVKKQDTYYTLYRLDPQ